MTRVHMNTSTGKIGRCSAKTVESCPFNKDGNFSHFGSEEVARKFFENSQKSSFNPSKSRSILKNLKKQTPKEIDEQLIQFLRDKGKFEYKIDSYTAIVHSMAKDKLSKVDGILKYSLTDEEAYERAKKEQPYSKAAVDDYENQIKENNAQLSFVEWKISEVNKEFDRRGGWTRAFIVTNGNGHIHSSMSCQTCNKMGKRTSFQLVSQVSGEKEEYIVDLAGERACTVCYPTAPLNKPVNPILMSDDERRKVQEAEERKLKKLEKEKEKVYDAKGKLISNTIRGARTKISQELSDIYWYGNTHPTFKEWESNVNSWMKAVSDKTGESFDKINKEMRDKARLKVEKERKSL